MNESYARFTKRLGLIFDEAGFELYLVGGALRDEFLERPASEEYELDFATNARPEQIVEVLERLPGISIYRVGEKFGTIGANWEGLRAEITTYRSGETYAEMSRKPKVEFGKTLDEDLSRRDFTINAMASPALATGAKEDEVGRSVSCLIDPLGGRADMEARLLRAVGEPARRFAEDPLRLLRAVRFAAELHFQIEPGTQDAMRETADCLKWIARERIAEELNLMLTGADPGRAMELLRDAGLLKVSAPQLLELDAMSDHGPRHSLSLWEHTMRVVSGVPEDRITRWAALLHDIGKPATRTFDPDGRIRFYHHEEVGAKTASEVLQSLKMSNEAISSVVDLVESHMQFHQYSDEWSDGAVRRLSERLGSNFDRALDLAKADVRGHGETPWGLSKVDALEERAHNLQEEVPEIASPLNGNELMEHYDRAPGPWIRDVKDALTEMVLEGKLKVDDKKSAWKEADKIVASTASR